MTDKQNQSEKLGIERVHISIEVSEVIHNVQRLFRSELTIGEYMNVTKVIHDCNILLKKLIPSKLPLS